MIGTGWLVGKVFLSFARVSMAVFDVCTALVIHIYPTTPYCCRYMMMMIFVVQKCDADPYPVIMFGVVVVLSLCGGVHIDELALPPPRLMMMIKLFCP